MSRFCLLSLLSLVLCVIFAANAFAIDGFPGVTWGELRFETPRRSTHGEQDLILQGFIRQGVDLKRWSPDTHLYAYGTVRYTWDSQQNSWWNNVGPGAGIAIDTSLLGRQFPTSIGVEYVWDRYFVSPRTVEKVIVYMNWFGWWDLGKKH
jgi:hypothetical protein